MRRRTSLLVLSTLFAAACVNDAARPTLPDPPPTPNAPLPVGVYEIEMTGIGSGEMHSTVSAVRMPAAGGASRTLTVAGAGIVFEQVASSSFTEGTRAGGGQRYVSFTYRVRNGTGVPLTNLTLLMVSRAGTIAGTPISYLRRFDGTDASAAIAPYVVPTGAVGLKADLVTMEGTYPDVLQVLQESEAAAVPLPGDVTGIFPYGYVVRAANPAATSRLLPAAATTNQYDGVLTVSFRLPLQPTSAQDVFSLGFQILAVQDSETRMTESIEEAQDTAAVRRLRERAAALGATTVTVLAGSTAPAADVADYPGQRQVCTVRTAGTAASPVNTITTPGAYSKLEILRPGESGDACGPRFRTGTASAPTRNVAYPVTVRAMDRYGNVLSSVADTVSLTQSSGPSATFGAAAALTAGQASLSVTYQANGTSLLTAVGRRLRGERQIEVATPATVIVNAGDNQAAMAGSAVPTAPSVLVRDLNGVALAGVPVTFTVASGGGYVTNASATTNASGVATVGSWVLGSPATANTLTATAAGAATPVTFKAAACSGGGGTGYGITLCYTTTLTAAHRAAFDSAAAKWSRVITGDLPDYAMNVGAGTCNTGTPSFNMSVDDLLIFVSVKPIDGQGAYLGFGGWCYYRTSGGLPIVGTMEFDTDDMDWMQGNGLLSGVILHEMGHVIGVGTRWTYFGYLQNASSAGLSLDTYYSGSNGITGFNLVGGNTYTGGAKVPVENAGGSATMNSHWRESVLGAELMTGYANYGGMPLSQLTARSLIDLGYTVNTAAADPFFVSLAVREGVEPAPVPLGDDVLSLPQHAVDDAGRVTRIR